MAVEDERLFTVRTVFTEGSFEVRRCIQGEQSPEVIRSPLGSFTKTTLLHYAFITMA